MGISVVLIMYFIVLGLLAIVCSVVLSAGLAFYLKKVVKPKAGLLGFAAGLPFLCVMYAGIWFIGYFAISDTVFHHDPMIGDGWYTNIGDGYAIDMIDVTDQGILHPTGGDSNGLNNPDGIHGVRRLQVAPPYLFGSQDSKGFEHLGSESQQEDVFFVIDTRDHAKTTFASEAALNSVVEKLNRKLKLEPILKVYQQQRSYWFDLSAVGVLLVIPAAALWRLLLAAYRLKRDSPSKLFISKCRSSSRIPSVAKAVAVLAQMAGLKSRPFKNAYLVRP